jgi:hypothetical protein
VSDQISTAPAADPLPSHSASGIGYGSYGSYGWPDQPPMPTKVALARWLVVLAAAGVVARLLIVVACGNRISFADNLLSGGTGTIDDADRADRLVTVANIVSVVVFFAFLGVLIAVGRRARRGDALCAAVNSNPLVKLTGRIYLISILIAMFLRGAFKQNDSASAEDQIRSVMHRDWATIVLNVVVIAFLVVIIVVTRREVAKVRSVEAAAG